MVTEQERLDFIEDLHAIPKSASSKAKEFFSRGFNAGFNAVMMQAFLSYGYAAVGAAKGITFQEMKDENDNVNRGSVYGWLMLAFSAFELTRFGVQYYTKRSTSAELDHMLTLDAPQGSYVPPSFLEGEEAKAIELTERKKEAEVDLEAAKRPKGVYMSPYMRILLSKTILATTDSDPALRVPSQETLPLLLARAIDHVQHTTTTFPEVLTGLAATLGNVASNQANSVTSNGTVSASVLAQTILGRSLSTQQVDQLERLDTLEITKEILNQAIEIRQKYKERTSQSSANPEESASSTTCTKVCHALQAGLSYAAARLRPLLFQQTAGMTPGTPAYNEEKAGSLHHSEDMFDKIFREVVGDRQTAEIRRRVQAVPALETR